MRDLSYQHAAVVALRKNQSRVELFDHAKEQAIGSGVVQSVKLAGGIDWLVTMGDGFGGAFGFMLSKVTAIRFDVGQPVLILVS